MHVIAVLNQKGGAGKTTVATHLARAIQLTGADVVLVDSDPQGSVRDWAAVREDQPLPVIAIDRPTIERDLGRIVRGKDYAIIDGAPQAHDLAVSAIKAADLVLIPVQPSPYDVWATSDLVDLVPGFPGDPGDANRGGSQPRPGRLRPAGSGGADHAACDLSGECGGRDDGA